MKIIIHEANGLQIGQRRLDGYINLTKMAQANGKKLNDYLRLDITKAFLEELSIDTGIPVSKLTQIQRGKPAHLQGTWGHPQVAINCAQWCSAKFAVLVSNWVVKWMVTGNNPIQPQPTSTEIPTDLSAIVKELENLIISIRSHGRTIHTGSHQPVDPTLFKSLHTLSHNQLSVISATIQQLELLKRIAEMNTDYGSASPEQTINYLFGSPTSTQDKKPQATETRVVETNPEITESSKTAADETEADETKQLTNINVKIPISQRQWLADTARQVRRNNTKPVAPSDRVYPQHLVSIAIALLQKSNIDSSAAHSIRLEQDEATANINIKVSRQQQEWLTTTAKTIRNSNQNPTCPHERIYPQHLIAIAVEQLQNANVRWHKVGNVDEIQQRLAKPCHLHLV
jgi:hypothetical protein